MKPAIVGTGHAGPVTGAIDSHPLRRAAATRVPRPPGRAA
jgi:hypothetical protein